MNAVIVISVFSAVCLVFGAVVYLVGVIPEEKAKPRPEPVLFELPIESPKIPSEAFPTRAEMEAERARLKRVLSCHNSRCKGFGKHRCHDLNCKEHP